MTVKHGRKVAVKVLHPELGDALGADRFAREVRIAAALNHPNILALHDSGEAGGQLYYVMPFIAGESLRHRLTREQQLPIDDAIDITRQVAAALDHAHARGLVHRDIKPENILLHEGQALVADFGIALVAGSAPSERLTGTGLMVGTPEYMSPEQAAGERTLDARSDVYALGCVLYEMLAGEPPFTGRSAQAVIAKRFTAPAPGIRPLRPSVPAAVEQALERALARVPADRFATAGAFAEALAGLPGVQPVARSVAVLPFRNLSADPENEFFADGITEDVIAQLSRIRSLKTISRSSVMPFKDRTQNLREIGETLNVAALLDGSVRHAGTRVRIVATLVDPATGRQLWCDTYDRELVDIFAIQSDVALQIAHALEAELSPDETHRIRKEPTSDLQAYQLYLQGRHCMHRWTGEGMEQALRFFEQAVTRDPGYALAHASLAYAYTDMALGVAGSLPAEEAIRRARAAATRALELDNALAEGHGAMAHIRYAFDYDWTGAEAEFRRAIELNPNSGDVYDAYGLMLSALERYDEAIEMQRRAHEIDPLAHRMDFATTHLRAGRFDDALHAVGLVLDVEPGLPLAHATLGWVHTFRGMPEQGLASLRHALSLAPDNTLYAAQLGQALAAT